MLEYITDNITSIPALCIFLHMSIVSTMGISKIMNILYCVEKDKNTKYNLCYYKLNELETSMGALHIKIAEFDDKIKKMTVALTNTNCDKTETRDNNDENIHIQNVILLDKGCLDVDVDVDVEVDVDVDVDNSLASGLSSSLASSLDTDYEKIPKKASASAGYGYWNSFYRN